MGLSALVVSQTEYNDSMEKVLNELKVFNEVNKTTHRDFSVKIEKLVKSLCTVK